MQTNERDLLPQSSIGLEALPATQPEVLAKIIAAQDFSIKLPQEQIQTDHVIHAGMYARTVTMPPDTVLIGTFIKIPTIVITVGTAMVLVGDEWKEVYGYSVLPASAGRKQIFVSRGAFIITMLFPTQAKQVEEAEAEFTDETDLLLSRRQDFSTTTITEEQG